MADILEWAKGITFFVVATFLFYFFWDNVFSNIISFLGTDIFNIGSEATTSISILKSIGWVSFVFLWLSTVPIYLIYSMIAGSKDDTKTNPIYLLKGIGIWAISMPILSLLYGIVYFLVTTMNDTNIIDATMQETASQFSWVMTIMYFLILVTLPYYYILQGYGINLTGQKGVST